MKFKLFGIEIYVSFLFVALITVMLATDKTGFMLPALFAVFAHEIGHLFMMWVLECTPKRIKLIPASIQITSSFSKRYKTDILVSLSGPAANILLFIALYFNYLAFKNEVVLCYALLNIIVAAFNLLPFVGLDGGTILYTLLCKTNDVNKAAVIMKIITIISSALLIAAAVILTIKHKINISLYIIGIYLFVMSLVKL